MKKYLSLLILVALTSCLKDGNTKSDEMALTPHTTASEAIVLTGKDLGSTALYQWSLESTTAPNASAQSYTLLDADSRKATFITNDAGVYRLKFTASNALENKKFEAMVTLSVLAPDKELSPYIAKVYDYTPMPGQFVNTMPEYKQGDTKADMIKKADGYLVGKKSGSLLHLGGFGGSVVFGFDHTVMNVNNQRDIRIVGNAFFSNSNPRPDAPRGGSCEPGIIMVSYDLNKNGLPDDKWYEIAGSEYAKSTTTKNYEITYHRPLTEEADANSDDQYVAIKNYIRWGDNNQGSGYLPKSTFHNQSYYPSWVTEDKMTMRGTLLPPNGVDESTDGTNWVLYAYGYGYADNALNTEDDSAFDISWAVNEKGESVKLPGVNFIKVYTGVNQICGWLGENSTEISAAHDLHLTQEVIPTFR